MTLLEDAERRLFRDLILSCVNSLDLRGAVAPSDSLLARCIECYEKKYDVRLSWSSPATFTESDDSETYRDITKPRPRS